jgi:miniconductance mechanosensitive channel
MKKEPLLESYLDDNRKEIENIMQGESTTLTNLNAFRAFMLEYLRNHKYIDEELPIMVRDMPPSENGMPVELYCFSKINQWVPYESVQSGIFDYIFAVVTQFGLRVFQNPAGSDIESLKK